MRQRRLFPLFPCIIQLSSPLSSYLSISVYLSVSLCPLSLSLFLSVSLSLSLTHLFHSWPQQVHWHIRIGHISKCSHLAALHIRRHFGRGYSCMPHLLRTNLCQMYIYTIREWYLINEHHNAGCFSILVFPLFLLHLSYTLFY